MKMSYRRWLHSVLLVLGVLGTSTSLMAQNSRSITTEAEFERAMEELSNWGRWGPEDGKGASNLITEHKRIAAAALVREGITVSMSHDVSTANDVDASGALEREVLRVSPTGASDRYSYSGSYHGTIHSHLDSVDCHIMHNGAGYNGLRWEEVEAAGACPRGDINEQKDGIITRGI